MPKILEKKLIRKPDVFYFKVEAPLISQKAQPGQFVIVRPSEQGERIPLSLADINPEDGSISLIIMVIGKTSGELSLLDVGDNILDVCGPLAEPTPVDNFGKVVLVGGGFEVAPLYPIAKAMKTAGNNVVTVMGARNELLLIYEKEMADVCDKVIVTTDDGSKGHKGLVTEALTSEIEDNGCDLALAVGPSIMMKFVSLATKPYGIKTMVSLNPIMVDGTGMCGGCRVSIGGKNMFACTDGPEFDGHEVDWDLLFQRQRTYLPEEAVSFDEWKSRHPNALSEQ